MARALFVASTKQHIGKTSSCSGLVAGLKERFKNVGYIKPVGQQHVPVVRNDGTTIRVDKDVRLFKEFFGLNHIDYSDMSPLIVPNGYTRQYLEGRVSSDVQQAAIQKAYDNVTAASDFTVLEGTGHCGVGSIIDMDNARVAAHLGVAMVLVCNAGVGSSFDELELNRLVCRKYGVTIKGVILNRVALDKLDVTRAYFAKALTRWGIPLVGCIPYNPHLYAPAVIDYEILFKAKLISGEKHRLRHFYKQRLMAASLNRFTNTLPMEEYRQTLWVTHISRMDLMMALAEYASALKARGEEWEGGVILAGFTKDEEASLSAADREDWGRALKMLRESETPVLPVEDDTPAALAKVNRYVAKLSPDDQSRLRAAVEHTKPCLDFDSLLS